MWLWFLELRRGYGRSKRWDSDSSSLRPGKKTQARAGNGSQSTFQVCAHQVTIGGSHQNRISGLFDSIVFTGQFMDRKAAEKKADFNLSKLQVSGRGVNFIESRMAQSSRSAIILERSYS